MLNKRTKQVFDMPDEEVEYLLDFPHFIRYIMSRPNYNGPINHKEIMKTHFITPNGSHEFPGSDIANNNFEILNTETAKILYANVRRT